MRQVEVVVGWGRRGRPHAVYGVSADSHNNGYFLDFAVATAIGRIDARRLAKSHHLSVTPTHNSYALAGDYMDLQDRSLVW